MCDDAMSASYVDAAWRSGKSKMAVSANMVIANTAPVFAEATAERSVEERHGSGYIGAAVAATDAERHADLHAGWR